MSKVKINYHESGIDRQALRVDDFWLVEIDGAWYPYDDHEATRVPAHRGEYDPNHWGEDDPEQYDYFGSPRHRKEGPVT